MSKLPTKITEAMQPFSYISMAVYNEIKADLHKLIALRQAIVNPNEAQLDLLNGNISSLVRLEQMRKEGWFISEKRCEGQRGWFDWRTWFKHQAALLEDEKATQVRLLGMAETDQAREAVLMSIARIQARIDKVTNRRPVLTGAQADEINQQIKQLKTLMKEYE